MKVLNVAEKPSVASAISGILSRGGATSQRGRNKYCKVFRFPFTLENQQVEMVVTSVLGHLMGLEFDSAYKSWHSCDPIELYSAPVTKTVPQNMQDLQEELTIQARQCQRLILWLDCDREGENIAFEVIEVCKRVNPRLQVSRAHFSALIPRDIFRATETLTAPNELWSQAVDVRQEVDLRIGASFTRLQTLLLQRDFPDLKDMIISYGSCQFPTLGFVVERFLRRMRFQPEPFWKIACTHKFQGQTVNFTWSRERLFDRLSCLILFERCAEDPTALVTSYRTAPTSRYRPLPLNTVELQKRASRFLRISSKDCMEVAEKLYQQGFISYPRTETDIFKEGTELEKFIKSQVEMPQWGAYAQTLLDGAFVHPRNGNSDDKAHPPIHPVKPLTDSVQGRQRELYEFIARHFLACCSANATGKKTTVEINIAGEDFSASGVIVEDLAWYKVYRYERWSNSSLMPNYQLHSTFTPTTLTMESGSTTPPALLKESDLIAMMDKQGIGTDATIASHIDTIQQRKYVELKNQEFHPTKLGVALISGYENMHLDALYTPEVRARMEADMKCISDGTKAKDAVLAGCLNEMKAAFAMAVNGTNVLKNAVSQHYDVRGAAGRNASVKQRAFSNCGVCGTAMDLMTENDLLFLTCATCAKIHSLPERRVFAVTQHNCPICHFQVLQATQEQYQSTSHVCPYCYTNPPVQDVEDAASAIGRGFMCRTCTFENCSLSTRKVPKGDVLRCPQCNAAGMTLRYNNGAFSIGCTRYPDCNAIIYLPKCKSIDLSDLFCQRTSCQRHQSRKVTCVFDRGQAPPTVPVGRPYTMCVLCDEDMDGVISKRFQRNAAHAAYRPVPAAPPRMPAAQHEPARFQSEAGSGPKRYKPDYGAGAFGAGSGGSNNGGLKCFKCGSPDHLANACDQNGMSFSGGNDYGGAASSSRSRKRSVVSLDPSEAKGVTCFKCKRVGHVSTDCPEKAAAGARSSSARGGRKARGAGRALRGGKRSARGKGRGGRSGGAAGSGDNACFICGETGHWASACPQKRQ